MKCEGISGKLNLRTRWIPYILNHYTVSAISQAAEYRYAWEKSGSIIDGIFNGAGRGSSNGNGAISEKKLTTSINLFFWVHNFLIF